MPCNDLASHRTVTQGATISLMDTETLKLRTVQVERYITPLREGGSMPAIVEADDLGTYVLKFRGAGQGVRALMAEIISGGMARALGLPVPEIVLAQLNGDMARTEADPEIQDLIRASDGLNVGLDYLPGSINFDPAVDVVDSDFASRLVWFDTLVSNVDRTARNTNMLMCRKQPWLIDHGASLTFHHAWNGQVADPAKPFAPSAEHVLLPLASKLAEVDGELAARLTPEVLKAILDEVPDCFLEQAAADRDSELLRDVQAHRAAYVNYFVARLAERGRWLQGVIDARA